jgi:hypothetical protein
MPFCTRHRNYWWTRFLLATALGVVVLGGSLSVALSFWAVEHGYATQQDTEPILLSGFVWSVLGVMVSIGLILTRPFHTIYVVECSRKRLVLGHVAPAFVEALDEGEVLPGDSL